MAKANVALRRRALMQQQTQQKSQKAELRGKIVQFLWWMRKEGYKESTIISRGKKLRRLVKLGANLLDPESVKEILAKQRKWSDSQKQTMVYVYDLFAKWAGISWEKPRYKRTRKLPFIPSEREIDDLIAGTGKYISTILQTAKETAARIGEILELKWTDVDLENKTIKINDPEKGSNPRIFKISSKLVQMLKRLPKKGERIFDHYANQDSLRRVFVKQRKRVAHKLGNPRIMKISFHTVRHWKATMEYYKTKDILHVMRLLGHRNIKNTLIYTHLAKFKENDEFICKVAKTPKEVAKLIEAGFEYVCEHEGLKFFRKRK